MICYEPGDWGITFALTLKGSVFPKSFAIAAPCTVLCLALHVGLRQFTSVFDADVIYSGVVSNVLGGFTSILGFLIVFRSQQAYSRWWEGGTLLQQIRGEWFNAYSCLLAFTNPAPEKSHDCMMFRHQLCRLFSMLYASALEQETTMEDVHFQLINLDGFDVESLRALENAHDKCEVVLQWIQKVIIVSDSGGVLKVAPPILSRVYNELGNGIVNLNNARKITEFPIPFPLAQMVTFMLVCHWFMTLVVCVVYVEVAASAGAVCFIVVFSFWTINYISLELEMPFGDDNNDLPLFQMQRDFNCSLICLLRPHFSMPPKFDFREEHKDLECSDVNLSRYVDELVGQLTPSKLSLIEAAIGPPTEGRTKVAKHACTAKKRESIATKKRQSIIEYRRNSLSQTGPDLPGLPGGTYVPIETIELHSNDGFAPASPSDVEPQIHVGSTLADDPGGNCKGKDMNHEGVILEESEACPPDANRSGLSPMHGEETKKGWPFKVSKDSDKENSSVHASAIPQQT